MGLIANYQLVNDQNLEKIMNPDLDPEELLEDLEDLAEEEDVLIDIDKMWDALHFVLTGVSCSEPIENNALSEAVVGVFSIDGIEEYISYIEKSRIKNIVFALDNFDIEKALETFSMEECKEAELYPNIWGYEEETEEIKEEIMDYFQDMKDFYKQVLEEDGNVLVTIY